MGAGVTPELIIAEARNCSAVIGEQPIAVGIEGARQYI